MTDKYRFVFVKIFNFVRDRRTGIRIVLLAIGAAVAVRIIQIGRRIRRFWNDFPKVAARFFGNDLCNSFGVSCIGELYDKNIAHLFRHLRRIFNCNLTVAVVPHIRFFNGAPLLLCTLI